MKVAGIRFVQGRNKYKDGDARKYGIAIHNTSNDASDEEEASYARRRPDGTSSHFYVDGDSVTQSIDTWDRAGHAGSTHGNDHGISVEITGGNGKSRAWWLAHVAWDELGEVLAKVIRHHWPDGSFEVRRASVAEMRRNPKVKALYGHDDMRRAWGGTDHTDPGPNFPWDRLIKAINGALGKGAEEDDMAISAEGRASVRAEAIAALETVRPYQHAGVRGRLKDPVTYPPKGWGDMSLRVLVEYLFERSLRAARDLAAVAREQAAAKLRDEAILARLSGLDQAAVLAHVDALAAAEATRDAETRAEQAVRHAELVDLLDALSGSDRTAEEVVRLIREKIAEWAAPDTGDDTGGDEDTGGEDTGGDPGGDDTPGPQDEGSAPSGPSGPGAQANPGA